MKGLHTGPILDRLRFIAEAKKAFDSKPIWKKEKYRSSIRLSLIVALRLNGVLRGGVSIRISTPSDVWEEDVYGHVEVRLPGVNRSFRINPIEWKPLRYHDNPSQASAPHRNQRLWDRWLPFDLNAPRGLHSFDQTGCGIAVPLPRALSNFSDYTDLCSTLWLCPDMMGLPAPPWARRML